MKKNKEWWIWTFVLLMCFIAYCVVIYFLNYSQAERGQCGYVQPDTIKRLYELKGGEWERIR